MLRSSQAEGTARVKEPQGDGHQRAAGQVEGSERTYRLCFWKIASVLGEESPGSHRAPRSLGRVGPWVGTQWPQRGWTWAMDKRDPEAAGVSHLGKGREGSGERVCLEVDIDSMLCLV